MNIADFLKQAFDPYYDVPLHVWKSIADLGSAIQTNSEQVLKENGAVERYLHLILKGSGGNLLWNKNNFICTDIAFEGEFLCDYLSFIQQKPTPYEVLTFEKSELFSIPFSQLDAFAKQSEYGDKIWRYATQALYVDKHLQQLQSLTLTAAEKYKLMQTHQSFVIQRIPQKYIASFLGIAPQSLSRIRKNITLIK